MFFPFFLLFFPLAYPLFLVLSFFLSRPFFLSFFVSFSSLLTQAEGWLENEPEYELLDRKERQSEFSDYVKELRQDEKERKEQEVKVVLREAEKDREIER